MLNLPLPVRPALQRTVCTMGAAVVMLLAVVSGQVRLVAQQTLVPAQWSTLADGQGMSWDFGPGGYVNKGTNNCFNNAMILQINGKNFTSGQARMTRSGDEYVMTQNVQNLTITRRVKVDPKGPGARWADSFTNTTNAAQSVRVTYYTRLSGQCQGVVTDSGRPNPSALGKKDHGIFMHRRSGQPSVIMVLASPGAKVKPTIANSNNYQFQIHYPLSIPAGKTVTLVVGMGQRAQAGAMPSGRELADLFKPFLSRDLIKDLPREMRSSIVNWDSRYSQGDAPMLWTLERDLKIERREVDVLAIGEETLLRGEATYDKLTIITPYGRLTPPVEDVAAIAGFRFRGKTAAVYLRDGQVLAGELALQGLTCKLTSGAVLDVAADRLDRLVFRTGDDDRAGRFGSEVVAMVDTYDGNRLAVTEHSPLRFTLVTPWGQRPVALGEIRWIRARREDQAAYEIALADGSRFYGMLDGATITISTALFGEHQLDTNHVRFITARLDMTPDDTKQVDLDAVTASHIQLQRDQVIVTVLARPRIKLLTSSGMLELPTDQIRRMDNRNDRSDEFPGQSGVVFAVELWDGSQAIGRLQDVMLPVRVGESDWSIPANEIVGFRCPAPVVSQDVRARIVLYIRDLGSDDWAKREQATRQLLTLGPLAAENLKMTVRQTRDPEVRRRAEAILTAVLDQID